MKKYIFAAFAIISLLTISSCTKDFLTEKPVDDIYAENLLETYSGFESMNSALLGFVRDEYSRVDVSYGATSFGSLPFAKSVMFSCGCDNAFGNNRHTDFRYFNFPKNIVGMTDAPCFLSIFEWLYKVINTANMVIERAENPDVNWEGNTEAINKANKDYTIAKAKLFRAWAYRHLTYCFGDVPLSVNEITGSNYRSDWERTPVAEVRAQMEKDLLDAIAILPMRVKDNNTQPSQAVARHYLGELYLAMGQNQKAIDILKPLVEGTDYELMTRRFGSNASKPGSAFIDVFRSPLYSEGNKEVLWAFLNTEDENAAYGNDTKSFMRNMWVNYYSNCTKPKVSSLKCALYSGQETQLFWSLNGGKGAGRCAICLGGFKLYEWDNQQGNDVRYDENSIIWHLYFLTDEGEQYEIPNFINLNTNKAMSDDTDPTIKQYNLPSTRKWQYVNPIFEKASADNQYNNLPYLRLADTYLLYAEAHFRNGDAGTAATWINKVRNRANCSSVTASDVTLDFILDERSRELITEEPRRETLIRFSQVNGGDERKKDNIFKTRVREHNEVSGREVRGMWDDSTPVLFPIPQEFINSNTGKQIQQNPGY